MDKVSDVLGLFRLVDVVGYMNKYSQTRDIEDRAVGHI